MGTIVATGAASAPPSRGDDAREPARVSRAERARVLAARRRLAAAVRLAERAREARRQARLAAWSAAED